MDLHPTTVRNLFPNLNENELKQIQSALSEYLALILRICQRIEHEDRPHTDLLTENDSTLPCTPSKTGN